MTRLRKTWLVINPASGSYDDNAFGALCRCLHGNDIVPDKVIRFPEDALPDAADLDAAGIETVTIYTGDGTINALVTSLYGWSGAVLALPGGTMNLLARRLHGDADAPSIVARLCEGGGRRVRPGVVRCAAGDALAGLMVGPGTAWNDVREAMRETDLVAMAQALPDALRESTAGEMVCLADPPDRHEEGFPLVVMRPDDGKIALDAYHSETVADYAQQGAALLKRDFREGPHDRLGEFEAMTMASESGGPIDALIDGEPARLPATARFELAACEVDLWASA